MKQIIGIRRETKNEWERRVPLTPEAVSGLIYRYQIEIIVESSPNRIFPDEQYRQAGAAVSDNISQADVILGVKEIPRDYFLPGKTYIFFSHTIKGQEKNIQMLKRMMELKCTLIDYEKIVNDQGQRLVFFSVHAGLAGMIDTLWSLGQKLKIEGIDNPFTKIQPAHKYSGLDEAKRIIKDVGEEIKGKGLPSEISPLTCAVLGYGRVAKGAQEILNLLPVEEIKPADFRKFFQAGGFSRNVVYKTVYYESDLVKHRSIAKYFDLQHYYTNPHEYRSRFSEDLDMFTIIVNCIYWDIQYPRFITLSALKELYGSGAPVKLKVIGDITCDVGGSVECTYKETDSGNPVFVYEPMIGSYADGFSGNGPVIMAVGNLPSELPLEASQHFSDSLYEFIPAIAQADYDVDFKSLNLPPPIKKAVILLKGELTQDFQFMKKFI